MSTMTRTARTVRGGQIRIGLLVAAALVILAGIGLALVARQGGFLSRQQAPAAVSSPHFSAPSHGVTGYQSLVPAQPKLSVYPRGFTDYENLNTVQPRASFSAQPHGAADYENMHGVVPAQPKVSAYPRGFTDYENLNTVQPKHSEMPRGYTDYVSPSK
jgi:hypothetical protein